MRETAMIEEVRIHRTETEPPKTERVHAYSANRREWVYVNKSMLIDMPNKYPYWSDTLQEATKWDQATEREGT